jgi:uncharacterized protein YqgV (UPF0045/DUF77 family)
MRCTRWGRRSRARPPTLAIAGELHAVPFDMGIPRVYSILKLDERRDREQTLEDKVSSVQALLDEDAG